MLDHVVLATPDLASTVTRFERRTGVRPAPGGSHVGRGTANHLVRFRAESSYLEIVGPDVTQRPPDSPRPFGIDDLAEARVVTWAVRPDDVDATIAHARELGHDPGDAAGMSRRTADGELLEWRLTPTDVRFGGLVPFLIDWGATPHPTTRALPEVELVTLRLTHPEPVTVTAALVALGLRDVDVVAGERPSIELELDTPRGHLTLPTALSAPGRA